MRIVRRATMTYRKAVTPWYLRYEARYDEVFSEGEFKKPRKRDRNMGLDQ